MANTPKKMKDPTEAALSAIQDALNVRDPDPATERPSRWRRPSPNRIIFLPNRPRREPAWHAEPQGGILDDAVARLEEAATIRRPANDDRESIGQILRTMQRRPARTSYLVATVFAVVWALAGLLLGWIYLPELKASLGPSGLSAPILAVLGDDLLRADRVLLSCSPTWRGARRSCG